MLRRSQPRIAPSASERDSSVIIRDLSKNCFWPRPSQVAQAPAGLLKENSLGSSSAILWPHFEQANSDENTNSLSSAPSILVTIAIPSAIWTAVSKLSARRCSIPADTFSLSTITSIVCFLFLSNSGGYSISQTMPSTRARIKPLVFNSSNT